MTIQSKLRGYTLIELIVVVALLGLIAAVAGTSLAKLPDWRESDAIEEARRARIEAIRTGQPVVVRSDTVGAGVVLFLPDGRALGAGIDPRTGRRMGNDPR